MRIPSCDQFRPGDNPALILHGKKIVAVILWAILTLFMFTFSILFAWVYNRTKGSILAPAIFHPSINAFGNNLPFTTANVILYVALAVFAILYDRMWKKLPTDDPAVYHGLEPDGQTVTAPALISEHLKRGHRIKWWRG